MSQYAGRQDDGFDASRAMFEALVAFLIQACEQQKSHAELEQIIQEQGRDGLLRRLLQDCADLDAETEQRRAEVVGADTVLRTRVERGHQRRLASVFGPITVTRMAYRAPWVANLYPADGVLNLPEGQHSYGLRRLVALEAVRGSFDEARRAIRRSTGVKLGKRQLQELTQRCAVDISAFYHQRSRQLLSRPEHLLVLQFDGKGIVMTHDGLRPDTAKAAQAARCGDHPPVGGLSTERPHRKRMAEIAVVHDAVPAPRTASDIINPDPAGPRRTRRPGPVAAGKWVTASITADLAGVVAMGFDEAHRRDPEHQRTWIALVDGNRGQINAIITQARRRNVTVNILLDFVHVMEYLWGAAHALFTVPDQVRNWVTTQATAILNGNAAQVAADLRAAVAITPTSRDKPATLACADYLTNYAAYLNYHHALTAGWPIATGVVEGACRHLVQDRMDITGARWGLATAEAVLRLRALITNDDFNDYWQFHQQQQHERIHQIRYLNPRNIFALAA